MTEWFLHHTGLMVPRTCETRGITARMAGGDIVWSIPVEWDVGILPLSELFPRSPRARRWHKCQARKRARKAAK